MATVSLRPITPENLDECISLKVADHQKGFVAPNIYSLAEASVSPTYHPFGIYDADAHYRASPAMVGFIMYGLSNARGFILRLMVDEKFQRRGYGRAAMIEVIRRLNYIQTSSGLQRAMIGKTKLPSDSMKVWDSLIGNMNQERMIPVKGI